MTKQEIKINELIDRCIHRHWNILTIDVQAKGAFIVARTFLSKEVRLLYWLVNSNSDDIRETTTMNIADPVIRNIFKELLLLSNLRVITTRKWLIFKDKELIFGKDE